MILLLFIALSIDSILNQPELHHAHFGVVVLDLETDSIVYARNAQKNLIPASNMKIITSAAALTFLGPDFRFKTRLAVKGDNKDSKWNSDIVIVGGGDPSFSLGSMEQFVASIKSHDANHGHEDIILVDDFFTDERLPIGWSWHYLDARYAAEVSALSLNRNVVNVHIVATQLGERAQVTIEPATAYVTLINEINTRTGEDSLIIFRRPEANIIYVAGGIGYGHIRDIEVAIKDPTMFFGEYLKERLQASGSRVRGECTRNGKLSAYRMDTTYHIIDSIVSMPLSDLIKELNSESVNLYGEALLKTLGAYYKKTGSFSAGVSIMKEFLRRCGVDSSHVLLYDGSGLSRYNLISPYDIALVLRYMYHSQLYEDFCSQLPGPGEGTLEFRFNGLKNFIRAKTGTLDAVSCLSGYLTRHDRHYCFSIMFNNFACPRKQIERFQEDIIKELMTSLDRGAL